MKRIVKFSAIVFFAIICACGQSLHESAMMDAMPQAESKPSPNEAPENIEITDTNIELPRKIIKEGTIRFETADVIKTKEFIQKSISENKGYVSSDNVSNYGGVSGNHTMTIRIPAEKFDTFLEQISENNTHRIDSKEIQALDVTEVFIDVEARVKTKKEIENRYKELLKQAHVVDDILSIEKEIGALRADIESMEGRLRYLKDKVAYSTLTLVFYEKRETGSSYSFGFGSKFIKAFYDGWTNILWFIIGLTNLWPFIIIITIVAFMINRIRKNKKKKNTTEVPPVK